MKTPHPDSALLDWLSANPERVRFQNGRWGHISTRWGTLGYWRPSRNLRAAIRSAQRYLK